MRSTSYQHFYRVHCWLSTRYNEWFSTELNASKSTLLPPRKSKYWSLVPFPRKKKIIWIPKENHRRIQCSSVASSRFLLQNLRVTLFLLVGFLYACLYWQVFRLRPDKKAPANGNDGNGNIWCIDSVCWCDSAEISSLRWKNGNETKKFVNSQRSNEIKLELLVLFRIFPMQFERIEKFNLFERFVRRLFWATRNTQRKTFPSNKNFYFIQKNLSLQ